MIAWLEPNDAFPPVEQALREPNGLLAASQELTAERLLDAYALGVFPWYSEGQPVLWWSPDPRMVLEVACVRVTRSLAKVVRNGGFDIRVDTAFREVMLHCAAVERPGQNGTWITPAVVDAYCELHVRGRAHSVESWYGGRLVGGLYGVSIGRMFFGESMFAHQRDASKVALVNLVAMLKKRGVPLIDCQQETPHLASFGARPIPRAEFAARCRELVAMAGDVGPWVAPEPQGLR